MKENEEVYVFDFNVETNSPKKNKDGCNQRTITWQCATSRK